MNQEEKKVIVYKGEEFVLRSEEKEWESVFDAENIDIGEDLYKLGLLSDFRTDGQWASGTVRPSAKGKAYSIQIRKPTYREEWSDCPFYCTCKRSENSRTPKRRDRWGEHEYFGYNYIHHDGPESWYKCPHMVPVMLEWEKRSGGTFIVEETENDIAERYKELMQKREQERLEKEREKNTKILIPVLNVIHFPDEVGPTWWNIRRAVENSPWNMTSQYAADHMDKRVILDYVDEVQNEKGGALTASTYNYFRRNDGAIITIVEDKITECKCNDSKCSKFPNIMCQHRLELLQDMIEWQRRNPIRNLTDKLGSKVIHQLRPKYEDTEKLELQVSNRAVHKTESLFLTPYLVRPSDSDFFELGYRIGRQQGRPYVLKQAASLVNAVNTEGTYELGKKEVLDFGQETFLKSSMTDLNLLMKWAPSHGSHGGNTLPWYLGADLLDDFYDLSENRMIDLDLKKEEITTKVLLTHKVMPIQMKGSRIGDINNRLIGISVHCEMPAVLRGDHYYYFAQRDVISRISPEEWEILKPLVLHSNMVRDETLSNQVDITIGKQDIPEFYQDILPRFLSLPGVEYTDDCRDEIERVLPPEPVFSFYLSIEKQKLICECRVNYRNTVLPLLGSASELRNGPREKHIQAVLGSMFSQKDKENNQYWIDFNEDAAFLFLKLGIPRLEALGNVYATKALQDMTVESVKPIKMQISVASNLLSLSIQNEDIPQDELLDLLDSYAKHKNYYRLRSGKFLDLTEGDNILYEFESLMEALRVKPTDMVRSKIQLPLYRALFLDRMLEDRDSIQTSRDQIYRKIIKNFATIRDSEWDVPEDLAGTLRPYQQYGYKWLKTLYEAGFGGILADEMGLGKTIQAIALLRSCQLEKDSFRALIVCPASLVYNWQEEIIRFEPNLRVLPMTGTVNARKEILKDLAEKSHSKQAHVYITSYDLLKRDIAFYEPVSFDVAILDEAQYIKNQTAAVSKAVKLIRADHRYALTGTPIENRLSELWSIFDFLMPGFLYTKDEFASEFEEPIVHKGDQDVTDRLRQMTRPFILRRLKTDVLKDLPPKLEEVRYIIMSPEQQKLYDAQVVHMRKVLSASGANGQDKIKIFAEMLRLRQICCDPSLYLEGYTGESAKREGCMDLITSAIDGGHRMLIFSQFTSMLQLLQNDLEAAGIEYMKITGETSKERRATLVRDFNEGTTPVFLISLKAGGTGLNLTGADIVIHYDPWWNLAAQNQATDRAHRIGQSRQVTVYKMIVKDTIEERIMDLQNTKQDLADSILSGDHASLMNLSTEELLSLLS